MHWLDRVLVIASLEKLNEDAISVIRSLSRDQPFRTGLNDGVSDVNVALHTFSTHLARATQGLYSLGSGDSIPKSFDLTNIAASESTLEELQSAVEHANTLFQAIKKSLRFYLPLLSSPAPKVLQGRESSQSMPDYFSDEASGLQAMVGASDVIVKWCRLLEADVAIKTDFFRRPFSVSAEKLYPDVNKHHSEVTTLRYDQAWLDRYSMTMKGLGKLWAEYRIGDSAASNVGSTQLELLQNIDKLIEEEVSTIDGALPDTEMLMLEIRAAAEKEAARQASPRFTVAFCGMVKAGKSLFINALIGASILPSDELPSTAWPCRLQHVNGHPTASLEIDASYFQGAIGVLKTHKYGSMMANFMLPPDVDPFAGVLDGDHSDDDECDMGNVNVTLNEAHTQEQARLREIYTNWIDLHPTTKANLLRFEQDDYEIPGKACGEDGILQLAQVNDVIRLCHRLNVPLPRTDKATWPLLKVEFEALKDKSLTATFEFIDLPGVGESSFGDFHTFEDLVRRVAKEANTVVPIVSLKEAAKDDWRQQLPDIIKTGLGRSPGLVICTHLDQVAKDRLSNQVASIAKVFWPKSDDAAHRVLCCSSRLGISARALLRQSIDSKPNFEDIWVEGRVTYDCAEKILGVGNPKEKFKLLHPTDWCKAVTSRLTESRLEPVITHLTTDIIVREHAQILVVEGEQLRRKIGRVIMDLQRLLSGMRRSPEAFDIARHAFRELEADVAELLWSWGREENRLLQSYSSKLAKAFRVLEARGLEAATQAVLSASDKVRQHRIKNLDELTFHHKSHVELFLRSVQEAMNASLLRIKRDYVKFVRELADRSRAERIETLNAVVRGLADDLSQNQVIGDIIHRLADYGHDTKSLLLPNVRNPVVQTISTRHNASTAYRAIEKVIAAPLLRTSTTTVESPRSAVFDVTRTKSKESDLSDALIDAQSRQTDVDELGFMLRAPIAAIATIPWLLGSVIWPFMIESKSYVINQSALTQKLQDSIIKPYLGGLEAEGSTTLEAVIFKSSLAARAAVIDALEAEEMRFRREQEQKEELEEQQRTSQLAVADSCTTILLNLLAAEAALRQLQVSSHDVFTH
ncbi:hypothetical protein BV22DRAFT_1127292 [Leucogyrophana mollusca]|uniref:Uncharacterized protein n=1 Tax=Leucogyrophana mollusca TaxID=85980 RepID=A0ACB8BR08_9AGAM|nr:hypothetical protein BV22DRAFT_1127292 [Leucogyrophana mollusca]